MPKYGLDHLHLISPEPEKTAQFYVTMFHAQKVGTREMPDGRRSVELELDGLNILVTSRREQTGTAPGSSQVGYGLEHFGIRTDNLEATVAELKAGGVRFRDEMRVARPGVKIAFIWAPENVLIELVQRSSQP